MKIWDRCFNELPDIIIEFDRNSRVSRANKSAQRQLCSEVRPVLNGLTCDELIHKTMIPKSGCPVCKLKTQRIASEWTGYCEGLKGRYHISTIPGETSEDGGTVFARRIPEGFAHHIPEGSVSSDDENNDSTSERQKTAEGMLRILEDIEIGIHVIDLDSYEIIWANDIKQRQFSRNIKGQPCFAALSSLDSPCDHCVNDKLIDNGVILQAVNVVRHDPLADDKCLFINKAAQWPDGRFVKIEFVADLFNDIDKQQ